MHRICLTLSEAGYDVVLIGRKLSSSIPLSTQPYSQKRITCQFNKGPLFYIEYNFRLLVSLLFIDADCYGAIDLDTILPNLLVSFFKNKKRVYDAHELFTEQVEIIDRRFVFKIWNFIEKVAVPKFRNGYTVNHFISNEFYRKYKVNYGIVRNLPRYSSILPQPDETKWIIYQGAVNEGRCFETLIPAMREVDANLVIYGNGNFFEQAKALTNKYNLQHKVILKGWFPPEKLKLITPTAWVAVTLFERKGLNQIYSLSNRFFDYIMAGIPQVCVDYPEYRLINDQYGVAHLISEPDPVAIATALNKLLVDDVFYKTLQQHCFTAREELNWDKEQEILLSFYRNVFAGS